MRKLLWVLCAVALTAILATAALAHDKPTLRVEPSVAPAGGSITCVGMDMEMDSHWAITLERAGRAVTLRDLVIATGDQEGGFTISLTIPADTAPGSYTVRATSTEGRSATADLTVTEKSAAANPGAATMRMASGEEHVLDRGKPTSEIGALWAVALAAAAAGAFLVLPKERA